LTQWGRTRDIVIIGLDSSPLHRIAREVAKLQGRRVVPDPEPEKGFFYRSDHFEFVKRGVPALYADSGIDFVLKPPEYGRRKRGEYSRRDYHKVTDEVKPDWDLSGAVEDLQFLFMVGQRVAK
jgi:Zn-dependent M28 family amino/carboxypeptidase